MNNIRPNKLRNPIIVLAAAGVALSAAACSGGADKSTSGADTESGEALTLTSMDFQYEGQSNEDMQKALDVCTAETGVTLNREAVPFDQFVQKVLLSASSQDLPDIMFVDYANLPQIAETGALVPLDEAGVDYSHIQANVLEMGTYHDVQYGAAPGVNTLALFYNKAIFEEAGLEPPTNWDELKETAKQLTTADRYGLALSANAGEEAVFQFQPFLWSNGGSMTELDSPEGVEALEYVTSLVNDGSVSKSAVSWSQADVNDQFIAGQAAMQINGSWQIPVLNGQDAVEWGAVPIPAPEGKTSVTPFGGETWVITAPGKANPASAKFVDCMLGEDAMTTWAEAHYYVPTKDELATVYAESTPEMAPFVEAVKTSQNKLLGIEDGYAEASTNLSTAVQSALTGEKSPADALAAAGK